MDTAGILKKMHYKGGETQVFNAPEGYHLDIESNQLESNRDEADANYQFVQLFVRNADEVREWLPKVIEKLLPDAVFWLTYPKQSAKVKTDIHRDILATMVENETTYRVVSNVSIDATWSALRLREKDKVRK